GKEDFLCLRRALIHKVELRHLDGEALQRGAGQAGALRLREADDGEASDGELELVRGKCSAGKLCDNEVSTDMVAAPAALHDSGDIERQHAVVSRKSAGDGVNQVVGAGVIDVVVVGVAIDGDFVKGG